MKKLLRIACLATSLALPAQPAKAGGVPTFDSVLNGVNMQQLTQLLEVVGINGDILSEAEATVRNLAKQIEQLDTQIDAMTGNKNISGILNSPAYAKARQIAGSLDELNATLTGEGLPASSPVAKSMAQQHTRFAIVPGETLYDPKLYPASVEVHDFASESTATTIALAEDGFTRANAAIARSEALIAEIDRTATLKASVDLNSRIMAEMMMLMAERMRMDAASQQMTGAFANRQLRAAELGKRKTNLTAGDELSVNSEVFK